MMDKMRMETADITAQNIEKIGALFPNCITEMLDEEKSTAENKVYKKAINFELLKQMLSKEAIDGNEAYEFTWVGKKASIIEANKPIRKTLRPCKDEGVNWDDTQNLYIEGDNLEVLKLLQESYLGKVKMIYIDPPYNTGNDFIYNDDFKMSSDEYADKSGETDEEGNRMLKNTDSNGRFHSDWCSMIYPRLLLARNLLSDDGVIFISIDDNEQSNLKKICDEVFGALNFVSNMIYIIKPEGRMYGDIAKTHEYVLVYKKKLEICILNEVDKIEHSFDFNDNIGGFNLKNLENGNPRAFNSTNRPNLRYPFYVDKDSDDGDGFLKLSVEFVDGYEEVFPSTNNGLKYVWRWGAEKSCNEIYDLVAKKNKNGNISIFQKCRSATTKQKSLINDSSMITQKGTKEILNLFDRKNVFLFPKPSSFVKLLVKIASDNNDIVLDFFSGSATTAHAVMAQNLEDGGNRKFIMVQLQEKTDETSEAYKAGYKNICEIGKERIRRAGKKILEENKDKDGIENLDTGFRVLKLDDTNMENVYYSPSEYSQDLLSTFESNVKPDRSDLDLLFGCLLEWGLPLSLPYACEKIEGCTVHNYNDGDLIACFDENIPESVIKEIAKKRPLRAVFRDSSFANSPSKINVAEIFKLLAPDTRVKVI